MIDMFMVLTLLLFIAFVGYTFIPILVKTVLMRLGRINIVDVLAGPISTREAHYGTIESCRNVYLGLGAFGMNTSVLDDINTWVHEFTELQICLVLARLGCRKAYKEVCFYGMRDTTVPHMMAALVAGSGLILSNGEIKDLNGDDYEETIFQPISKVSRYARRY